MKFRGKAAVIGLAILFPLSPGARAAEKGFCWAGATGEDTTTSRRPPPTSSPGTSPSGAPLKPPLGGKSHEKSEHPGAGGRLDPDGGHRRPDRGKSLSVERRPLETSFPGRQGGLH